MVSDLAGCAGRQAWLHLALTPGVGPAHALRLLSAFGIPERILGASGAALAAVAGPGLAGALLRPDPRREAAIENSLQWASQPGCRLVALDDPDYPAALLHTPDPPPLLWVRGQVTLLASPALAIVGSRAASADGCRNAEAFARTIGEAGVVVVSGLAAGIDSAAHRGALATAGSTIAVLATGIDRIYPPGARPLAQAIAERGLLIAERPPGSEPSRGAFPRRNRLIAGLARGVLVVEAAVRSGSLITARLAADLGREVFALPGSIHSPMARGCHRLIREGASLVESAAEILADPACRFPTAPAASAPDPAQPDSATNPARRHPAHDRLLAALGWHPVDADTLLARLPRVGDCEGDCEGEGAGRGAGEGTGTGTGTSVELDGTGPLLAALAALELEGRVERLPDGRFRQLGPG